MFTASPTAGDNDIGESGADQAEESHSAEFDCNSGGTIIPGQHALPADKSRRRGIG